MNCHQAGNALALHILAAHGVAGTLGGDHENIHIFGRNDLAKVDGKAVSESQGLALGQMGLDVLLVHIGLLLIVDQDHDDVRSLGRVGGGHNLQAGGLGLGPAFGAVVQADDDVDAALMQVEGVGVPLGAVADDRHGLVLQYAEIAVVLVIDFCHCRIPPVPDWRQNLWNTGPGIPGYP